MFYSLVRSLLIVSLLIPALAIAAPVEPGRSATVRLDIASQILPAAERPAAGIWDHVFRQLGIRKQGSRYIEPGSGLTVFSTAYAPSPYQTDGTPCITASGTKVRPGVVAANFLPFGTLLQIGNDVYIVEDRMNPRYPNSIDIFFPSTSEALAFGSKELDIVVIGYGEPGQPLPRELPPEPEPAEENKEIPAIVDSNPPNLADRVVGRLTYWQRVASDMVGIRAYDVNRYDVDCLTEE